MDREIKVIDRDSLEPKIGVVVGTRPGIVMFAPIIHELKRSKTQFFVIHTGQHYSPNMDALFFEDLALPASKYRLRDVSTRKTHGGQTAVMLEGIERILLDERPALVLVGGDANTNLAGALAARKLHISVGHVEAGERSYDWCMPEEHNRRIIDHISDYLFTTGEKGKERLQSDSVQGEIYIVVNQIVDASIQHLAIAKKKSKIIQQFNLIPGNYALLTMHREENVDLEGKLRSSLEGVSLAAENLHLAAIFLVHPRTQKRLRQFGLWDWVNDLPGIVVEDAVGYLDFLNLIAHSQLVFSDSGGVQQEACIHRIPTVTLRENTEWIETLEHGANRLAGTDKERIVQAAREAVLEKRNWPVPFGRGDAAKRIVKISKKKAGLK